MATSFLLILFLISIFYWQSRTGYQFLVTGIAIFILIGNGILPSALLNNLQAPFLDVNTPVWKNKNTIILLGGGAVKIPGSETLQPMMLAYSRINAAARLYFDCHHSGHKCVLIISGGDAAHVGESEAGVYQQALTALGVNTKDILLESRSMNTYQNAKFTKEILKKEVTDQIFLVTSGLHLNRSVRYFNSFDIKVVPIMSDYLGSRLSLLPSGYNFALMEFALHEYLGIARLYLYDKIGLND